MNVETTLCANWVLSQCESRHEKRVYVGLTIPAQKGCFQFLMCDWSIFFKWHYFHLRSQIFEIISLNFESDSLGTLYPKSLSL